LLTGLANRRSVDCHLDSFSKDGTLFSIFYIDLNGFKKINDTYGHQAGDELLKQVGVRLRLAFRSTDLVGRWGGDEFMALVNSNILDTRTQISRISEQFSKPFLISSLTVDHQVCIDGAVGVATRQPGETVAEVIRRADAAMYEQKLRA